MKLNEARNQKQHICEILDIDPREIDEWKDRRKEEKL